jgi:co-chaperonin GroES (HSP10)
MNKFQATGRRVMVKPAFKKGETENGIIVPDSDKKPDRGIIVSVGHEVKDPAVEVGKFAVFSEYAGKEFKYEGETYILLDSGELYITRDV